MCVFNQLRKMIGSNDPFAGSPTKTLLRLLLPLNDKVYTNSSKVSWQSRRDHKSWVFTGPFIGRSDGRCVQRAGTYSMQADDLHLQGIPRWWSIITMIKPQHDASSKVYPILPDKVRQLVECIIVARVQPRTSKGITDLLLPQTSIG